MPVLPRCPQALLTRCLKPEAKDTLVKVLTAHVVSGKLSAATLKKRIKAGGGKYNFSAVSGDALDRDDARQRHLHH